MEEQESLTDLTRAQRKALEKKRRKAKREKERARLMKEKPDANFRHPKDEEEIRIARNTMGNLPVHDVFFLLYKSSTLHFRHVPTQNQR